MFSNNKFNKNLFNNDSDSDNGEPSFGTNKDYAKNYNKFRSKELIKKHKDKDAKYSESDSSSDEDSSDNDTINPQFDQAFYKTLASIKKRDPTIYDGSVKFFGEFDTGKSTNTGEKKSEKAFTVKDYERKILLEKGGIYEEDEAEIEDPRSQSPTYTEEQKSIKNEFKKLIDEDSSDGEEWGGIFRRRDKSKEEEAKDDEQYTKWLAGEQANIGENAEALKPLKEYWNNPRLGKEEIFLRDYILNNGYTKKDTDKVPTYEDIICDEGDELNLSDDEAELDKQAEFEQKFNFRFEEPDSEFIKRYPRTIDNSVRKTDDRRKEKRVEVKERKQKEKEQKMRDLEVISALKKKEIEDKIEKLKQVTGNEVLPFDGVDLDGDFDPDEYDRKMEAVFNNEYYQIDEGETKPECPDIEDLKVEDWDNYDPKADDDRGDVAHCEDDEFNMDCDFDPEQQKKSFQDEIIDSTRDRRKRRKRRTKFVEMLKKEKPVFDPNDERTYGEYLEEYYKLDYEDVIGDVPCRFKYSETVPNDFGLSVEEIIMAKNKELNQWASLKKATQIRPEHVERNEVGLFKQKGRNEALKRKILQSLYEVPSDEEGETQTTSEVKTDTRNKKKVETFTVETIENFKMEPFHNEKDGQSNEEEEAETLPPIIQQKSTKKRKTSLTNDDPKASKMARMDLISKINSPEHIVVPAKEKSTKVKSDKPVKVPVKTKSKHEKPDTRTPAKIKKKKELLLKKNLPSGKKHDFGLPKIEKFKQKLKKKPSNVPGNKASGISDERLRAFGINPKKYHKKLNWEIKTAGSALKQTTPKSPKNTTTRPKNMSKKPSLINKKASGPLASPSLKKSIAAKAKQNENNKKKLLKFLGKSPKP